jgi:hypothetical protein
LNGARGKSKKVKMDDRLVTRRVGMAERKSHEEEIATWEKVKGQFNHIMKEQGNKKREGGGGRGAILMRLRYHAGSDVEKENMRGAEVPAGERNKGRRSDGWGELGSIAPCSDGWAKLGSIDGGWERERAGGDGERGEGATATATV